MDLLDSIFNEVQFDEDDEDRPTLDLKYPEATINQFFSNPIWQEMEGTIKLRIIAVITELMDYGQERDNDLIRKGQLKELFWFLRIKDSIKQGD